MNTKTLYTAISIGCSLLLLCGCDEKSQKYHASENRNIKDRPYRETGSSSPEETKVPPPKGATVSDPEINDLKDVLKRIFSSSPPGAKLSLEDLDSLAALVPRLRAAGMFWDAIGAVPAEQLPTFKKAILEELDNLEFQDGSYEFAKLSNAYRVAGWLRAPEVAAIAFGQLQRQKPFVYPQESPVKGWPTARETEYLRRGNQGILAAKVVEYGDNQTMDDYRKMVVSSSNDSQRVLIWALGRSPRLEDFEFLIQLREKIHSPETTGTLIGALNRIPNSMEIVVKSPESTSLGNRPENPEVLLQTAEACRKRLSEMNLTVEPIAFDDY
jgi:hypothetical protein